MSKLFVSLLQACFGSGEKEKEMMKPYHFSICDFLRGSDDGMGRSILLQQPFLYPAHIGWNASLFLLLIEEKWHLCLYLKRTEIKYKRT